MPRPTPQVVSFTIDGREVSAPENTMLVDAAKHGDVEIPVFCYEPKLGGPVGACRMCLVEVEGIPKLQAGCATPVKDGMVVHTQTAKVREAQEAVVEFLLINHPLDCPVCDRGGECPLQDITMGWGPGRSRFIEPKRHFRKPLELSPLIAIDRERCILCYRCVRFSQEVAEDYQLVLHERGADSFVGTFDGHPYVAPFSGNIIELCPVGALTSRPYRFRARPWDIEGSGSICTLCPSQCNVDLTVRDDAVLRVLNRHNDNVDDGWLCDKGRFAYQAISADERIVEPLVREGDELRPASWERAWHAAATALAKSRDGHAGALAGGGATNEEGFLLGRVMREACNDPDLDCRPGGSVSLDLARALAAPALQATVSDLEFASAVLVLDTEPVDAAPIIELRIRKGVRRRGVQLAVATSRPSALDSSAQTIVRFAPGAGEALLAALDAALTDNSDDSDDTGERDERVAQYAACAGCDSDAVRALAAALRAAAGDLVVVYGERLLSAARADHAASALLNVAERLGLAGHDGAGLLEIPDGANHRGLREAGVLPNAGPGYAEPSAEGRDARAIAEALVSGDLATLYLLEVDPLLSHPDGALWEQALASAGSVIAHASALSEGLRRHADVIFPAEAYAEKEGTVTHPDGRLQRLRPAIGRPPGTRPGWQVLAELSLRLGLDLGVIVASAASSQLFAAVGVYGDLTLEQIGGTGVRWPERAAADALPAAGAAPFELERPPTAPRPNGALRLGSFPSLWSSPEVSLSPALRFLVPEPLVELAPTNARQLGLQAGDPVTVSAVSGSNGDAVQAIVSVRDAIPPGSAFLAEAASSQGASRPLDGSPRLGRIAKR
ncbi:MAG: NADH-quinone oxidoreductase subunit NuoG [Solirubrobacteraceae bacterium]|nr:MAG: NADH dehydrogenase (quinone) subunit G [Solirubrobacterales bacterium]